MRICFEFLCYFAFGNQDVNGTTGKKETTYCSMNLLVPPKAQKTDQFRSKEYKRTTFYFQLFCQAINDRWLRANREIRRIDGLLILDDRLLGEGIWNISDVMEMEWQWCLMWHRMSSLSGQGDDRTSMHFASDDPWRANSGGNTAICRIMPQLHCCTFRTLCYVPLGTPLKYSLWWKMFKLKYFQTAGKRWRQKVKCGWKGNWINSPPLSLFHEIQGCVPPLPLPLSN